VKIINIHNHEYKGVRFNIPDDALKYAGMQGIDLFRFVPDAINRMLRVSGAAYGDFEVAVKILNPSCSPDECCFDIRVCRVTTADFEQRQ